jgi:transcriptional regulator with XRE-family HTH domain
MDRFTPEDLALSLRVLRYAKGWGAKTIAARAGLTASMVCRYEHGRTTPTLSNLQSYLGAMECDFQALTLARDFLRKLKALETR